TAAMKSKLTESIIRSYKPRAKPYSIGDAACPGLRLQITPKGIKTFAIVYRDKGTGKIVWLTVGRHPDVPLAHAREFANDARKVLEVGRIRVIKTRATEQAALTKMIFRVERSLSRIAEALDRSLATEQPALTKMIFRIERRLNRLAEALARAKTAMKGEAWAR